MNTFWKRTFLYLSSTLIVVILALVLEGKIVFSLPDKKENCTETQTITIPTRKENWTAEELENPPCVNRFENYSSEIDGMSFEYVQSHIPVMLPPKIPGGKTDAKIAIVVRNNREQPIRFSPMNNFQPLFLQLDNTPLPLSIGIFSSKMIMPREEHYPLIHPTKSITLTWNISFEWIDSNLRFVLQDNSGYRWDNDNFKWNNNSFQDNRLKVYFNYSFKKVPEFYIGKYQFSQPMSELGEIWTGSFCTTPVEIELID